MPAWIFQSCPAFSRILHESPELQELKYLLPRRNPLLLLPDNAGNYVTVRGRVVALEHADQLARKYTGQPYPALPEGRAGSDKILPERVSGQ